MAAAYDPKKKYMPKKIYAKYTIMFSLGLTENGWNMCVCTVHSHYLQIDMCYTFESNFPHSLSHSLALTVYLPLDWLPVCLFLLLFLFNYYDYYCHDFCFYFLHLYVVKCRKRMNQFILSTIVTVSIGTSNYLLPWTMIVGKYTYERAHMISLWIFFRIRFKLLLYRTKNLQRY